MYVDQLECYLIRITSALSVKGRCLKCVCTVRHGKHVSMAREKEHPFRVAQAWESGSVAELSEQVQRLDGLVK